MTSRFGSGGRYASSTRSHCFYRFLAETCSRRSRRTFTVAHESIWKQKLIANAESKSRSRRALAGRWPVSVDLSAVICLQLIYFKYTETPELYPKLYPKLYRAMGICYWLMCVCVYQFTNSSFFPLACLPLHSLNLFKYFPSFALKNVAAIHNTLHHFAFRFTRRSPNMMLQTGFFRLPSDASNMILRIWFFQNLILQTGFSPNYCQNIIPRTGLPICANLMTKPDDQTWCLNHPPEPHGSQAPRMTYFTSSVVQRQMGEQVEIGCAAQAFPLPQFRYRTRALAPFI